MKSVSMAVLTPPPVSYGKVLMNMRMMLIMTAIEPSPVGGL
ncbi:MAG: hypothetical protein ABFD13_00205 [Candidatus Cryosericum sp.]